jgi:hypothetical protein
MKNLISLQEASVHLRVNVNTLKYWVQNGKVSASKSGSYNGTAIWLVDVKNAKEP